LLATEQYADDQFNTAIGFQLSKAPRQNIQVDIIFSRSECCLLGDALLFVTIVFQLEIETFDEQIG
jgi:hypothetical protein